MIARVAPVGLKRGACMPCCGRNPAGPFKKAAQLRGGSRAAQDWGYEHEYAITDLMQPQRMSTPKDVAAKVRNIPISMVG